MPCKVILFDNLSPSLMKKRAAFTLTEMIVVILIIVILMSVAGIGLRNAGKGRGVVSASDMFEGMLREARSAAMGRGKARLLIVTNPDGKGLNNEHLRRLAVVVDGDGDMQTEDWVLLNRTMELPSGVFFSPKYSVNADGDADQQLEENLDSFVLGKPGSTPSQAYFIEFNNQGMLVSPSPGQKVVFLEGGLQPGNPEPKPASVDSQGRPQGMAGVVLHRMGNASRIKTNEQFFAGNQP